MGSFSAGWLAGKPDYLQKLKVPEGYEKINDYSNIWHGTADGRLYRSQMLQVNTKYWYAFESSRRDLPMHSFALLWNNIVRIFILPKNCEMTLFQNFAKFVALIFAKFSKKKLHFFTKNEVAELCKGVHCVDLGESFQRVFTCKICFRYSRVLFSRAFSYPSGTFNFWG